MAHIHFIFNATFYTSFHIALFLAVWLEAVWLEDKAVWLDSPGNGYMKFQENGADPKFNLKGDKTWRHVALQFDQVSDVIRFFLDGFLVSTVAASVPISSADCTPTGEGASHSNKVALGHSHPGYTYGRTVELFDLRMYVHDSLGNGVGVGGEGVTRGGIALGEADFLKIAKEDTNRVDTVGTGRMNANMQVARIRL
jgi:hypothetical protein